MKVKLVLLSLSLMSFVYLGQTEAQSQSLPVCVSAASDPDGDGYGWENNQSCISAATSVNQVDSCEDHGGFPWGWNPAAGVSCRLDGASQTSPASQTSSPATVVNTGGSLAYPQRTAFEIKSLGTDFWPNRQELLDANISGVQVNLVWANWQPSLTTNCTSEQIRFDGQCFTINTAFDERIKYWSSQGKPVTGILYGTPSWARDNNQCTAATQDRAIFCAARNPNDYARFTAMIAERYNGLNGNGRVVDFVIHNEVNLNEWYKVDCGAGIACDTQRWIDDYARNFNAAYDRITAIQPQARVMVPFAHQFDPALDNPSSSNPVLSVQTFLRGLHARAGGRTWRVAYHPYHVRLDSAATSYDDLPYVTFGNIGVLAGWLRQEFAFQPESWEIHLTENGVSSNGLSNEQSQDIAVCNSYRNVLGTPGIENYIYHRMQVHPLEADAGGAFGLRRSDGSAKPVWNTWSQMSGRNGQRNNLDCGFEHLPYVRLVNLVNSRGDYRASTRVVGNGFNAVNDWYLLREPEPNTTMAYECRLGAGSYVSTDVHCGGALSYGPLGYVHYSNAADREPLFTCSNGSQNYSSSSCNGDEVRELIGYAKGQR